MAVCVPSHNRNIKEQEVAVFQSAFCSSRFCLLLFNQKDIQTFTPTLPSV